MTKDGKTVFIDRYGNFTYKISDVVTDFSVDIFGNNGIECKVSAKDSKSMNDYIESLVSYDISDARLEKEHTKVLVRKMFYKNEEDSE